MIDSEGCFAVTPREVAGKWYLPHVFAIALLAQKNGKPSHTTFTLNMEDVYTKHGKDIITEWVIYRENQLLKFLNDYIPYLKIKRDGAERLRTSLIAYVQLSSKGKPTRE